MRFKKGNVVEVFKRNDEDQYGGWFPATILFIDKHKCSVKYEFLLAPDGNLLVEVVNEENVRPQLRQESYKERWFARDIAEVFKQDSWRVGKIVKVLKNGCVVIRLFGSAQLEEFRSSSLRIQRTWRGNRWIMFDKVQGDQVTNDYTKNDRLFDSARNIALGGEDFSVRRPKQDARDSCHKTTMKRKQSSHHGLGPDDIIEGTNKRKKGRSNGDRSHQMDKYALSKKFDAISFPKCAVAENFLHKSRESSKTNHHSYMRDNRCYINNHNINNQVGYSHSKSLEISEDNNECSVASCSANQFHEYSDDKSRYRLENTDNDAISSCASDNANYNCSISAEELAESVHELELHAYQLTMQALYDSGPLSWEQESLLTNLRMCLNISNEEHLLHLRHLLSV